MYKTSPGDTGAHRHRVLPKHSANPGKSSARSTMMFPCSALPPPLYPGLLRPPAALSSPLTPSLPSGFLVEDILRLSQPVSYIHRSFSSRGPVDVLPLSPGPGASARALGASTDRPVLQSCGQQSRNSPGSPQTACPDSGLKFGVSAILAPSARSGEYEAETKLCYNIMSTYIFIVLIIVQARIVKL